MQSPKGEVNWSVGSIQTILPNKKIVFFRDFWQRARRGYHAGIPLQLHDECVQGWNSSLNKLQKLVERH